MSSAFVDQVAESCVQLTVAFSTLMSISKHERMAVNSWSWLKWEVRLCDEPRLQSFGPQSPNAYLSVPSRTLLFTHYLHKVFVAQSKYRRRFPCSFHNYLGIFVSRIDKELALTDSQVRFLQS